MADYATCEPSRTPSSYSRLVVLLVVALLAAVFFVLDLDRFLSIDSFKAQRDHLVALYRAYPLLFVTGFMAINVTALTLCLPGAVLSLSLAGGAIFGFGWGTLIVLSAVTIGDSLAFLLARYLVRGWVERKFERYVRIVDRGVDRNGAFYLLSLRLLAVIPFFVVNLTMGLTRMPLKIFAPVSFVGLLPATALYVFTGTGLAQIDSPSDIYSAELIAACLLLALLAIVPAFVRNRSSACVDEI